MEAILKQLDVNITYVDKSEQLHDIPIKPKK